MGRRRVIRQRWSRRFLADQKRFDPRALRVSSRQGQDRAGTSIRHSADRGGHGGGIATPRVARLFRINDTRPAESDRA